MLNKETGKEVNRVLLPEFSKESLVAKLSAEVIVG